MILNWGSRVLLFEWQRRSSSSSPSRADTVCCLSSPSSSSTAEQLRQQLDNLHKEADSTRAKATNARLRLMRLSEAAEKLRRQAAVNVQTGKENDARDLLFQKKKVMQAMEKLKTRIELFDELSSKLNETISVKESLLIGNMSADLDVTETETPTPIRIVSPKEENPNNLDDNHHLDMNNLKVEEDQLMQVLTESHDNMQAENDWANDQVFSSKESLSSVDNNIKVPKEVSTYEDYMNHIDQQLNKIEDELETFLSFSSLLLEHKENPEYSKVQYVMEILEGVRDARQRIATIIQTKMSSSDVPS